MPVPFAQHRTFTVEDYYRMLDTGILREDDRVELIDGEIIEMTPAGSRHAATVKRINAVFGQRLQGRFIVGVQDPVRLSDRVEPQPDLAVLHPRPDFYGGHHPGPADVLLIVEVADSSVVYDRNVKANLYARFGIPEYWLVDLTRAEVTVHGQPAGGRYQHLETLRRGEGWTSQALPDLSVQVEDLIGS